MGAERERPGGAARIALTEDVELVRALFREYADSLGLAVQMRIGVNTGEVLVGALRAGGDYTAMGDVVNAAQRLQTAAKLILQIVRHAGERVTPLRAQLV